MRRVLLTVVLGLLVLVTAPSAADNALEGVYKVEGTNANGKPYEGIVEIVAQGDILHVRWSLPGEQMIGFGFVSRGLLAIVAITPQGIPLQVVYALKPDGPLEGEWAAPNDTAVRRETLTKLPNDHPEALPPAPSKPPPGQRAL